jgi:hypothetical protein
MVTIERIMANAAVKNVAGVQPASDVNILPVLAGHNYSNQPPCQVATRHFQPEHGSHLKLELWQGNMPADRV